MIFQPFQQADETVLDRFGGTGLGLAICKQLVEQVNGTISVASEIGKGSCFRIEVPVDVELVQDVAPGPISEVAVKIISFGDVAPDILASAQSLEHVVVRQMTCRTAGEMAKAMQDVDLNQFDVALVAETLVLETEPDDGIWTQFADAEVAPVLVSGAGAVDIEDVRLRAAFASILPPSPSFDQLRSAIRIGCSFAHKLRVPHIDDAQATLMCNPRKVLVADDNRTNRNVLAAILEAAGHEVTLVTDGDEAIEALERSPFDILLLDVNMPRLNGIDACMMWRQIEGGRQHIPIIGVTADATAETEYRCKNAGMDLRLTKPVDAKLLLATIEQYCNVPDAADHGGVETTANPLNVVVPFSEAKSEMSDAIDKAQLDYLLSIGDVAFVASMIDGFFEDVDQTQGPLRCAVEQGDVREFRFYAHAIKSSANNMGAKYLAALCGKFEKITEADFAEHRHAYLEKIESEIARATDALQALNLDQFSHVGSIRL